MRTFFTLAPDPDTAMKIHRWCELCWPSLDRRIPVQNYHITLAFLGEVDEGGIEKIVEIFEPFSASSFELLLNDVGYWSHTGLLWLGPKDTPMQLATLAKQCARAANRIGARGTGKKFQPHLTLARKLSVPPANPLIEPEFAFTAESLQLWSSTRAASGARYSTVCSWLLN